MTGGGSGGHITPILAVAKAIKEQYPDSFIDYISEGGSLDDVAVHDPHIDAIHHVWAGKFRRYHGEGWRQLLDYRTMYLNLRDISRLLVGFWQCLWLLRKLRPDVIFTRGSFVSVPVCLAGALLRIPYVTHDSDAIPSLTNRIIARWAALHAVALPEELYPYPIDSTVNVGVPVSHDYHRVIAELKDRYKKELGYEAYKQVLFVTGGGHGAQAINDAMVANAQFLLERYPKLLIVHATGRALEQEVSHAYDKAVKPSDRNRIITEGYIQGAYRYSGAADIVIARGGATTLAELAIQAKACVIVPSRFLTGGHQLKNAAALAKGGAIVQMTDEQIEQELRLGSVISDLLDNPAKITDLERHFASFARPDAARQIAELLVTTVTAKHGQVGDSDGGI